MKNQYISDLLKFDTYSTWLKGQKVLISAPTGAGKTTFILRQLLDCCKMTEKRMLILCNRRLLATQYNYDLAEQYSRYEVMCSLVEVWTYQQLAEKLKSCTNIRSLLKDFEVVVCDEAHFFYADSDFNGFGTFCLLQALIIAGFYKTIIMVSATMDEVKPLIIQTFNAVADKLAIEDNSPCFEQYKFQGEVYNFQGMADYSRFKACWMPDIESLANEIATSDNKSIIFIDDKNMAEKFRELLLKSEKIKNADIFLLNASILDEQESHPVIKSLVMTHRLIPKVLITTSVLDNGVSIHDEDVGNVVIATESKVSFLQMLGRVRAEETEKCKLFIFPRSEQYYERRKLQYEEKLKKFESLETSLKYEDEFKIISDAWYGSDEEAEFVRNAVIVTKQQLQVFSNHTSYVAFRRGDMLVAINDFAKEKTGNMLLAIMDFYKLALDNPVKVAQKQLEWIKKEPNELNVLTSSYLERRKKELIEKLLMVKDYTKEELVLFKDKISREFRKELFGDIVIKNGSFATEKLEKICLKFGLMLTQQEVSDGKQRYTILEQNHDKCKRRNNKWRREKECLFTENKILP